MGIRHGGRYLWNRAGCTCFLICENFNSTGCAHKSASITVLRAVIIVTRPPKKVFISFWVYFMAGMQIGMGEKQSPTHLDFHRKKQEKGTVKFANCKNCSCG